MKTKQIKGRKLIDLGPASRVTLGKGSIPTEEVGLLPFGGISVE